MIKIPFQQLDVKLLNLDYGCQHMYMNMHLKLVEKVIWFINFYFLNSIFSAFLDCLHTQIQNWQSSINNLPIQTISDWGPIFVQRWMLWYTVGIFLQNDNNCNCTAAPNSTQTCFLQTLNVLKKIFLIDVLKIEAQVLWLMLDM